MEKKEIKMEINELEKKINKFTSDADIAEYLKEFILLNKEQLTSLTFYNQDGIIEYNCEHGVGHTIYSKKEDELHGCCQESCCKKIQYPKN